MSSSMDFSNTFSARSNSNNSAGSVGGGANVWTTPTATQTYAPGGVGTTRTASSRVRGFSPGPGRIRERSQVVEEMGGDSSRRQATVSSQQSFLSSVGRPRSAQSVTLDGQRVYGEYSGSNGVSTGLGGGGGGGIQLRLPSLAQRN